MQPLLLAPSAADASAVAAAALQPFCAGLQ
jgi:hypothetical protein